MASASSGRVNGEKAEKPSAISVKKQWRHRNGGKRKPSASERKPQHENRGAAAANRIASAAHRAAHVQRSAERSKTTQLMAASLENALAPRQRQQKRGASRACAGACSRYVAGSRRAALLALRGGSASWRQRAASRKSAAAYGGVAKR
jgi:hypothetical protein